MSIRARSRRDGCGAPGQALAIAIAMSAMAACGGRLHATTPSAGEAQGVEAAGLPFVVLEGRGGRQLTADELWARLGDARAVCAGEQHTSPHDHWVQLQIVDRLSARGGAGLALGLEMVQQPFQGVLDDWAQHRIDDAALLSRTDWAQRWGFPFELYRPMLALARNRHVALVALNAPSELVKQVARKGLDDMAPGDRARLPQLVLDDAQHRAWFDHVMSDMGAEHGHGGPPPAASTAASTSASTPAPAPAPAPPVPDDATHAHVAAAPPPMPSADDIYAAQVVWDESMADAAARHVAAGGRIIILAGNGHCHDSAIVRRLARRGVTPIVSVRPLIDDGEGNVAAALAEGINDYLVVMTAPPAPAAAAAAPAPAAP